MDEQDSRCRICKKPKSSSKLSTITQWVSSCTCGLLDSGSLEIDVEICHRCNKRFSKGRKGSLTTYVFSADWCDCEEPLLDKSSKINKREKINEEEESDLELQLDPKVFPTERYKPIKELGRGASGIVYLSRDRLLNKKVAVKIVPSLNKQLLVDFQNEAKITSQLNHENIIQILDFGLTESITPYMVLEYLPSIPLSQFLQIQGAASVEETSHIFMELSKALSYAHEKGVFHRDLKPSNILLSASATNQFDVHVIDFGVAMAKQVTVDSKEKQGLTLVGTPIYMSPDQALGLPYDERSEVYSIGVCLIECLTGKPPFAGNDTLELMHFHSQVEPPALKDLAPDKDFPDELQAIVDRCLNKNPDERFSSVKEFNNELLKLHGGDQEEEQQDLESQVEITSSPIAIKSTVKLLSAVTFLLVAISAAFLFLPQQSDQEDKQKEIQAEEFKNHFISHEHLSIPSYKPRKSITDQDLALLKKQDDYECLFLNDQKITGEGLRYLVNRPLKAIYLADTNLTDEGLDTVSKFKSLETLALGRVDMSNGRLEKLAPLVKLKRLMLNSCSLKDEDMVYLRKFPELEHLEIGGNNSITAEGYNTLAGIPKLQILDLSESSLGDETFEKILFSEFKNLKTVTMLGCANVSRKALIQVQRKYPRITIIHPKRFTPESKDRKSK